MKKLKLLPTILMIALCVGILAIGIYAVKPTENNISGSITVNASNAAVKLELLKGDTVVQTFESVRSGATFNKIDLEFDVETANVLSDVERLSYSVRITNLSSTPLGAYFFNESTTLAEDGIATATNILKEDTINTTETSPRPLANVLLSGYTFVPAAATEPANTVPVTLTATMALNQFFDTTVTGEFSYVLNIEPYQANLTGTLTQGSSSGGAGTPHTDALLKLPIPTGEVTTIPNYAFYKNTTITDVVIPYGYTSIGNYAFGGASSAKPIISRVSIPSGITTIENGSFNYCSNLKMIDLPKSLVSVGSNSFDFCSALSYVNMNGTADDWAKIWFSNYYGNPAYYSESLYINNRLLKEANLTTSSIGSYVFANNKALASVSFADTVADISSTAFYQCTFTEVEYSTSGEGYTFTDGVLNVTTQEAVNAKAWASEFWHPLILSVNLPNDIDNLGYAVFSYCSSLTSIDLSACVDLTIINDEAFVYCPALSSVKLPSGVTSLGCNTFRGCVSLTNIEIPKGITILDCGVFAGCKSLTSVTIPNNVTSINDDAFSSCSSLTSIEIPRSVTSMASSAFSGCKFTEVKYSASGEGYTFTDGVLNVTTQAAVEGNSWRGFVDFIISVHLSDNITWIGGSAFSSCGSLTSIEIPSYVISIGDLAFYGCSKLATITVKAGTATTFTCKLPYDGFKLNGTIDCTTDTAIARVADRDNVYTRTVA